MSQNDDEVFTRVKYRNKLQKFAYLFTKYTSVDSSAGHVSKYHSEDLGNKDFFHFCYVPFVKNKKIENETGLYKK